MTDRLVAGIRCSEAEDLAAGFVLGALEPADANRVRAHLAACPEFHPAFAELGSVAPVLFESLEPAEPSEDLRGRILAAAAAERTAPAVVPAAPVAVGSPPASPPARADTGRGTRSWLPSRFGRPIWNLAAVAAALAVVVLGAWNLQLRAERDELAAYQRGVAAVLETATRPGSQLAVLAPGGTSTASGIAAVSATGGVQLAIRGLAPTTGSQVYEAWVIGADAVPVPIGGFAVGASGAGTLLAPQATGAPGVVVALTLEAKTGATTPTMPIIASGTAQARPG